MFKTNDKVVLKAKTTVGGGKDMSGAKGVVAKVFESLGAGALAIVMIDGVAYKIPVAALELAPEESGKVAGEIAQVVRLTLEDFRDYAERLTSLRYVRDLISGAIPEDHELEPEEVDSLVTEFVTVADVILGELETMVFGAVE
jgi:hypothetical protein